MSFSTPPCRFYIVRHGETEWNQQGRLQGQQDSPLTEAGIRQAVERSQTFRDIEFADAFSSDLFRTQRTAELLTADRQLAIKTTQLLRERSFGTFEGATYAVWQTELQKSLEEREALSEEGKFQHKHAPDIESDEEISTRMLTFIRQTAVAYPDQNVLVVAHGGIMRATLNKLAFTLPSFPKVGHVQNLGYFVLQSDGVEFNLLKYEGLGE